MPTRAAVRGVGREVRAGTGTLRMDARARSQAAIGRREAARSLRLPRPVVVANLRGVAKTLHGARRTGYTCPLDAEWRGARAGCQWPPRPTRVAQLRGLPGTVLGSRGARGRISSGRIGATTARSVPPVHAYRNAGRATWAHARYLLARDALRHGLRVPVYRACSVTNDRRGSIAREPRLQIGTPTTRERRDKRPGSKAYSDRPSEAHGDVLARLRSADACRYPGPVFDARGPPVPPSTGATRPRCLRATIGRVRRAPKNELALHFARRVRREATLATGGPGFLRGELVSRALLVSCLAAEAG